MDGPRPSERICELMQTGVQQVLAVTPEVLEQALGDIDLATVTGQDPRLVSDPALVGMLRRANRSNVEFWVRSILRDPAAPVPANVSPEVLAATRDFVRRGLDEAIIEVFRVGQTSAWQNWMAIALHLTDDPDELRELVTYSSASMFAFIDATIHTATAQIREEREQLTRGTHAQRLQTVTLIIEGAPIAPELAVTRLGYRLDRAHVACVVWTEDADPDPKALDRAAGSVIATAAERSGLTVTAGAGAVWLWIASNAAPALNTLEDAVADSDAVRIAVGPAASGIDGFRRSHLDALETQRLLMRADTPARAARWDDVQLAAMLAHDELRASEFIQTTLGDFAAAPPDMRQTVRVYLREQSNAARAAKRLHMHRNTILARLARAEPQLPGPIAANSLNIAAALELMHWRD